MEIKCNYFGKIKNIFGKIAGGGAMKKIGIMTDSHSGILQEEAEKLGIKVVPMPFFVDGKTYYEGVDLSREEFYEKLRSGAEVATSQPSLQDTMDMWDAMLKEYERILYIPISSGLSGSCMTAQALAMEPEYEGKVLVVDCGHVSAVLHCTIFDALELVEAGYEAEEIKQILESAREKMIIYIGLTTLENLKKGGRINPAVATMAAVLNIKPVMKLGVEKLDIFQKCRGEKKMRSTLIEAMKTEFQTNFKEEYEAGEIRLLAASSSSSEEAGKWVEQIKAAFPGMDVLYDDLTFGLACHTGCDAVGIGCVCKPKF